MTTQTTEFQQTTGDSTQRKSYMEALSLAEVLVSQTETLPSEIEVRVFPWRSSEPELRFYFHMDIPGLRQFRDDQMLTERTETRADGSVYVEAKRDMDGVLVVAWSLTDPPETDATRTVADTAVVTR